VSGTGLEGALSTKSKDTRDGELEMAWVLEASLRQRAGDRERSFQGERLSRVSSCCLEEAASGPRHAARRPRQGRPSGAASTSSWLGGTAHANDWLTYLNGVKDALGNLSNDISFVATLLIKDYLRARFDISDFDAGGKAQGAAGLDIAARTPRGRTIVGELKTTKPYQPGFGAQQLSQILKDLNRLEGTAADHRIMFVTNDEAFRTLCGKRFAARAPGVEIVNLVTGQTSNAAQPQRTHPTPGRPETGS
jgi:hypothetical protein